MAAGCLLQFARVLLQIVHPSAEKVTEEEWVGAPTEGVLTREVGSPILSHGKFTFAESGAQQRGHTLCPLDKPDVFTCVH